MRLYETFLHPMAIHHAKRHDTPPIFDRKAIHGAEVIGEIQSTTVKLHMTIGAQAEDVAVDIRTTLRTTKSVDVRPFCIIHPTRIDPEWSSTNLADVTMQTLHAFGDGGFSDDTLHRS